MQVREDALHLLHVLGTRHWAAAPPPQQQPGTPPRIGGPASGGGSRGFEPSSMMASDGFGAGGGGFGAGGGGAVPFTDEETQSLVLVGNLQDAYENWQLQVSSKFARWVGRHSKHASPVRNCHTSERHSEHKELNEDM